MRNAVLMQAPGLILLCVVLAACAGAQKPDARPRPVDDPTLRSLTYIIKASFSDAPKVVTKVLGMDHPLYAPQAGRTAYDTPYWHLDTQYVEFEQEGKKHRSKCKAHVHPFKEYPAYLELDVTCDVDSYSFGLGRGGIHNLFSDLRWDWYPEEGIYLTQEKIESIVRALDLKDEDVIRLRRFHSYEQQVQLIRQRAK